ncbi:ANTH-domain-containing protein [Polychaeton citri CBS 116435]|uniref:ANTH-domain-containing protein n=1 Tax=Polychaeton citri CBS 116435 TaxID=1314669 RepID=A0A9P4UKT0_9PEZI|nr:ANTH-domain-containing protein [Polychaeton citri CBS 116435]
MASNFEKSVKGGTKVKLAPPKSKYVEHILVATQTEAGVAEVFRTLTHRLRDSTWTVAFKSLIIVHLMVKEGAKDTTLGYLSTAPTHRLAVNNFTDVQTQGHNIRQYSNYLIARARAFQATKCDYVRIAEGRMKSLSVDKGLLRETETIQEQIRALVKCDLLTNDTENEISLTAFRLLTRDLLDLFNVQNEAVMGVLSHYFEMSKPDAERAIKIYKTFCKQTDQVVQYLSVARQFEYATRLEIPKIKHAPTSLVNSLQEYLDDKDFEINRRQYLAEQDAKKFGKPVSAPAAAAASSASAPAPAPSATKTPFDSFMSTNAPTSQPSASAAPAAKGPAPDLIDFFDSIEQKQQTMPQQPPVQAADWFNTVPQQGPFQQPQQTAFAQQPTANGVWDQQQSGFVQSPTQGGPWQQDQSQAFFQPQQQQQQQPISSGQWPQDQQSQSFQPQQASNQPFGIPQIQSPVQQSPMEANVGSAITNPFRQSMMPQSTGNMNGFAPAAAAQIPQRTSTNPFARQVQPQPIPQTIQAQPTGTNPFARSIPPQESQQTGGVLQPQATGTNPFRQSAFVNQQTGQAWQQGPQATMGGLENLETISVFPRPAGQQPQQSSPWG